MGMRGLRVEVTGRRFERRACSHVILGGDGWKMERDVRQFIEGGSVLVRLHSLCF